MIHKFALAGIHTGIGKTIAAAVLAEVLGADYWKPVQAGNVETDTDTIKLLLDNGNNRVFSEAYLLAKPASPHEAAKEEGIKIDLKKFNFPKTNNKLIVETAGGVHSPITDNETMVDFMKYYNLPVILVSKNYLGSINHTLLSIDVLKSKGIHLLGIIMNGETNKSSETFIEEYAKIPIIARIPHFEIISKNTISCFANTIKDDLCKLFI